VYVYDAFGALAEEWSPANTWSKDYVPFGGQVAAIENATANPCTTCYLTYDHLGTVRLVTDAAANVMGRHDYLPFGDEIPGGVAGRSSQFGPYVDNVNQKFTGQYRDSETSNDFFNARYFSAPLMRFLSADPAGLAAVDITDPQTWNQYAYVRGNPLAYVDPSGMFLLPPPGVGIGWDPCDIDSWDFSDDGPPCGVSIPIVPPIAVGGGGGGRGGSGSAGGSASNDGGLTPSSPSFPPGSFPGGENLGLPPGMSVPGPLSWQALLGLWGWDCAGGICVPGVTPMDADSVFANSYNGPQTGSYWAYAACYLAAQPKALVTAAFGIGGTAALGKGYQVMFAPPANLVRKLPVRVATSGLKWGTKGSVVGAGVFLATFEVETYSAAKSCSDSTGYVPWALQH
jgi:RHS repeat-associated protein